MPLLILDTDFLKSEGNGSVAAVEAGGKHIKDPAPIQFGGGVQAISVITEPLDTVGRPGWTRTSDPLLRRHKPTFSTAYYGRQ